MEKNVRVRKIGLLIIIGGSLIAFLVVQLLGKGYLGGVVAKIALIVLIAWIVAMGVWSLLRR